ncbi:MAG: aminomethyl-transferring glycine dehydrogenase subunit GcvPB [Anaerolineae bacterium]
MSTKEPVIYELGAPGRCAVSLPELDVPLAALPDAALLRQDLELPEVTELDLMRHYVHLSQMNYGVDTGFYPLGSCTMKYNPKVNEVAARLPGFVATHPYQTDDTVQGNLALMYGLEQFLAELSGFYAVSLQPAAGAQGELTGLLIIRAYHRARGDAQRTKILIPDSAHGTNPASTVMAGFQAVELPSDARGNVDLDALRAQLDDTVAGMMLTNPNTLGLFDENLTEITRLVHEAGGLMYGDGANFNALMGIAKPAELGFDVMHFNLHKTFSTPHGGGGPGSGPVGVIEKLAEFLPGPIVMAEDIVLDPISGRPWEDEHPDDDEWSDEDLEQCLEDGICEAGTWYSLVMPESSIGRVKSFYGQFGLLVRAYTYIRMLGASGLREVSETAVLNANYLQAILKEIFPLPYARVCMHEFVLKGVVEGAPDIRALDIAKRLIDYGIHPPTNYFPLIVPEALMIEPTETESRRTLDAFADVMTRIAKEARETPDLLHQAPVNAPVGRLDEVRAARTLILRWMPNQQEGSAS